MSEIRKKTEVYESKFLGLIKLSILKEDPESFKTMPSYSFKVIQTYPREFGKSRLFISDTFPHDILM